MKVISSVIVVVFFSISSAWTQVTGLNDRNIFLDPGHSGKENMGIYNYSEAEKNLRVALELKEILMTHTDIDTVYLSRTNDQIVVSLSQRTDYANALGADWYHSLHSDAGSPDATSTLLLWGQYFNKTEKVPNGGKAMSDIMIGLLTRGMRTDTRGSIGDCTFYTYTGACSQSWPGPYLHVNRESIMPSELSEAGFHTNPKQNQLNMNAEWRRLQAMTFYWSILKFFDLERPPVRILTGIVTVLETGVPINGAQISVAGQTYSTDTYESLFHNYSSDPNLLHNGFYYFENLPAGVQEVIVSAPGFYNDTLEVAIADTFFTFQDVKLISTIPPYVTATTPAVGDTNFPAWNNIVIDFSRKMDPASVETTVVINPPVTGSYSWSNGGTRLTFHSDDLQFETDYTFTISGTAKDAYGHFFDGNADGTSGDDFTLSFQTGPSDMTPPKIVTTYPPQNGVQIESKPIINITFDEQIDPATLTEGIFKLERFSDKTAVPGILKHDIVQNRSVLCYFPATELFTNEIYVTRIYPGLQDLFGNTMTSARSYSFKTGVENWTLTKIDDFEGTAIDNWWAPQASGSTTGILTDSTSRDSTSSIASYLTTGHQSMCFHFGWDTTTTDWLIREYLGSGAPRNVTFSSTNLLQVYVFGDGSGVRFRFALDDHYPNAAAENHEVSPWYTIDWYGWKLVSWDMINDSTGSWLGDGILDGTLRFDSMQLTYFPGTQVTGTLYFDDLCLAQIDDVPAQQPLLPTEFVLYQNYPNPFNPTTFIQFNLPKSCIIELELFDLMGKEKMKLLSGEFSAGLHTYLLDAGNLASGTYFYRLKSENFEQTRKLILLR